MARGGVGFFNPFRDEPDGLEGVTGGGAGVSLVCWRGLGVERSMVWAERALGVEGAGWPSSPTSMASSLSEEGQIVLRLKVGGPRLGEAGLA